MDHRAIAGRFNARFRRGAGAVLIGGAEEPLYLPATRSRPAHIRYARDHARSALHELAHFCLAGPAGRALPDFGLAYEPPPRSPAAQRRFFEAEVPVQALEMLFSEACGIGFRVSTDNPGRDDPVTEAWFAEQVRRRCRAFRRHGPGACAEAVLGALSGRSTCR